MFTKFKRIFSNKQILRGILFTLLILFIFKLGTFIPIPMVDSTYMKSTIQDSSFLVILNAFSGGGLSNFSLLALGISPYITSSIIVQMLQLVIPKLKEWSEQGEVGKQKLNKTTRYLTIFVAMIQALALLFGLGANPVNILINDVILHNDVTWIYFLYMAIVITAGSCFTMWLADLITRHGVGNGSSMIIAAGIISTIPTMFSTLYNKYLVINPDATNITLFCTVIVLYILMILAVVFFEGAKRKIPINYTIKQSGGAGNIPIKLNTANVIPVIFASTILSIPLTITGLLGQTPESSDAAKWVEQVFSYREPIGIALYILLIFFFSFFYSFMMMEPEKISDNLDRQGAFIPGYRRGEETKNQISRILFRVTLLGATYLAFLALVPIIVSMSFGFTKQEASVITIGGTSLIIVVGVAIETFKQIETAVEANDYKGLLE